MNTHTSRRRFLAASTASAFGVLLSGHRAFSQAGKTTANDKLNLGFIAVGGQAEFSLNSLASQNIVALCDVDAKRLAKAAARFPGAKTHSDFRRLLDQKDLDAIIVATPDHTHAICALRALQSGRHVYCEKPLTRTVSECRAVREAAAKAKLVTQMGTQIHAGSNYRRVVELVQSGAIGAVREVHTWVSGGFGNKELPADTPPVPEGLDWDLWLGPVPARPYHSQYAHFNWRHWWAFGGGTLADLGCHHMDLAFWALDLRAPTSIEAVDGPKPHPESAPHFLRVKYGFPARGAKPPVTLTWHHGGKEHKPPQILEGKAPAWGAGNLFVGEKGMLIADYNRHLLLPEADFKDFKRPDPTIKDSIGHHREWIEAIKTGGATTCNFDYSGALTEAVLLGNVAFRSGKKLEWDAATLRASNAPESAEFIQHRYREGWSL